MINKPAIHGANPYMPLWEHVPDGEPRVFTYNGESRVYVYGSHDTEITAYCGRDYVVWSAPVTDLTSWTCHGTCYTATDGSILYAPDVVEKDGVFYMYAAEQCGSVIMVARSHPGARSPIRSKQISVLIPVSSWITVMYMPTGGSAAVIAVS